MKDKAIIICLKYGVKYGKRKMQFKDFCIWNYILGSDIAAWNYDTKAAHCEYRCECWNKNYPCGK